MREQVTVPGFSKEVFVARFPNVKHEWIVLEGDPCDRHPMNYLTCQELRRGGRLAESIYSGGSANEIIRLRTVSNNFIGPMSKRRTRVYVDVAPDDLED